MTGADPEELRRAARGGVGQAWTLTHSAGSVEQVDGVRRWRGGRPLPAVGETCVGLRRLGERLATLDDWVEQVAAALQTADATSTVLPLLGLGVGHPASELVRDGAVVWSRLRPGLLSDRQLGDLVRVRGLPARVRDRVERERLGRWVGGVEQRVAAAVDPLGRTPLDRLARWVDARLVDLVSPIVDLHDSHADQVARLRGQVEGARLLLRDPRLTILTFDPDGPAVRVALGDLDTASRTAVLLPGTGTGLHALDEPLADAVALHDALDDRTAAVVVDLHRAPTDLGRAADPAHGRSAAATTAAFLTGLPPGGCRLTLVGHSYGAFTAAETVRAAPAGAVDALVLLGAPGVGVASTSELPVAEVWADRAPGDPVGIVADLDEHVRRLPRGWVPGPLTDPLVALGPDPTDPEFGARPLHELPASGEVRRGHLDYLTPGTATLARVAAVVSGSTPTRDRPTSAGGG